MKTLVFAGLSVAALCFAAGDGAWPWSGHQDAKAVTLLLLGDVSPEQRADPASALEHTGATLRAADLAYGNLEGLLVKSEGPDQGYSGQERLAAHWSGGGEGAEGGKYRGGRGGK